MKEVHSLPDLQFASKDWKEGNSVQVPKPKGTRKCALTLFFVEHVFTTFTLFNV